MAEPEREILLEKKMHKSQIAEVESKLTLVFPPCRTRLKPIRLTVKKTTSIELAGSGLNTRGQWSNRAPPKIDRSRNEGRVVDAA